MTARSTAAGHEIYFDGAVWRYVDSAEVVNHERACSACGRQPVIMELTVPAHLSSTGADKRREWFVDACIAPLVQALNDGGLPTIASCCGHGHRPGRVSLRDGRDVLVCASMEEAEALTARYPDIHGQGKTQNAEKSNRNDPLPPCGATQA